MDVIWLDVVLSFTSITIDTSKIVDWESFHDVFASQLGFTEFYGRNMNAWIDCMTSIDSPDDGLTDIHAPESGAFVIQLSQMDDLRSRCPEIASAIEECTAFVNYRRIEGGEPPVLMLAYS